MKIFIVTHTIDLPAYRSLDTINDVAVFFGVLLSRSESLSSEIGNVV